MRNRHEGMALPGDHVSDAHHQASYYGPGISIPTQVYPLQLSRAIAA